MIRLYSLLIVAILSIQIGYAQNIDIDECDLTGKWGLESSEGEFNFSYKQIKILLPDSIEVYTESRHTESPESLGVVKYIKEDSTINKYGIQDIFITNMNKLHILLWGGHLIARYKILYFDGERIKLQTMDGLGNLTYRRNQPTSLKKLIRSESQDDYISLKGIRLKSKPNKEPFIYRRKVYLQNNH